MDLLKKIVVPTGEIFVAKGEKGLIEFLNVGDYGKNANIKADFLGITRELNGVPNGDIMPLSEKWVITLSTQYGCSMNCKFCDVHKVGLGLNATLNDMNNMILIALAEHKEISYTKRLNIHYARMGEPTFNFDVLNNAKNIKQLVRPILGNSLIHPVISTMLPKNNIRLVDFLLKWAEIKNIEYNGDAGLQFSINSTDDEQRDYLFSDNSLSLKEISQIGKILPNPFGRKYTLNFALSDESIIDANRLASLFSTDKFMVKITPLHVTANCIKNNIVTTNGYNSFVPYKEIEEKLKKAGFDVIIFVPSSDEENGMITCGNAILSGKRPKSKYFIYNY